MWCVETTQPLGYCIVGVLFRGCKAPYCTVGYSGSTVAIQPGKHRRISCYWLSVVVKYSTSSRCALGHNTNATDRHGHRVHRQGSRFGVVQARQRSRRSARRHHVRSAVRGGETRHRHADLEQHGEQRAKIQLFICACKMPSTRSAELAASARHRVGALVREHSAYS